MHSFMANNGAPTGAAAYCRFHVCSTVDLDHGAPYTSSCALRQALLRVVPSSTLTTAGPFGPARAEALSARALKSGPPSWSVRSGPVRRRPVQTAARSGTGPARTVSTLSPTHQPAQALSRFHSSSQTRVPLPPLLHRPLSVGATGTHTGRRPKPPTSAPARHPKP